jgi:RNA 3'-terminal phosphate cyclase
MTPSHWTNTPASFRQERISFTAPKINMHARTNMAVISAFLPIRFETREEEGVTRVDGAAN